VEAEKAQAVLTAVTEALFPLQVVLHLVLLLQMPADEL